MAGLQLKLDPSGIVSGGAVAESALEKVQREAVQTETALASTGKKGAASLNNVAAAGTKMQRSFGGNGLRMASMQLSQVAQQGAVTGNYLQALMIQIPDLALGFGAVGIVIGALVPVVYGVAKGFMDAGGSAESLEDRLETLASAMDALTSAQVAARTPLLDLMGDFGRYATQAQEIINVQREMANLEALSALSSAVSSASEAFGKLEGSTELAGYAVENIWGTTNDLREMFDLSAGQATALAEALREVGRAEGPEAQVTALRAAREQIELATGGLGAMDEQTAAVYRSLLDAELAAAQLASVDVASGLYDGADAADALATNLFRALDAKNALGGVNGPDGAVQQSRSAFGVADNEVGERVGSLRGVVGQTSISARKKTSAKSSGGSSASTAARTAARELEATRTAYDSLRGSLDPLVAAELQLADAQATVNEAMAAGFATASQGAATMALAQKEFDEVAGTASGMADYWGDLETASTSALDSIRNGSMTAVEGLKSLVSQFVLAIAQKNMLAAFDNAKSAGGGLGGIVSGLFGGFFDSGGTLGMGKTGIVGENGPERITATTRGAVITSRADTAREKQSGGAPTFNIDARGAQAGVADQIVEALKQYGPAMVSQSVSTVKENLPTWNAQYSRNGAL